MLARLITGPSEEPVTLAEAKVHLRLEHDDDDAYVSTLITAARQFVEEYLWRAVLPQTWELTISRFPFRGYIELPKGELRSVTSVSYLDSAGVSQPWAAENYEVETTVIPGRLRTIYGGSWPTGVRSTWNAAVIRYVVGWENVAAVPAPVKQAILLLVSQMYEHRTPEITGTIVSQVDFAATALLRPYRLARVE